MSLSRYDLAYSLISRRRAIRCLPAGSHEAVWIPHSINLTLFHPFYLFFPSETHIPHPIVFFSGRGSGISNKMSMMKWGQRVTIGLIWEFEDVAVSLIS